jgi:bacillithiol biosynthesis deacetylase BshB1
MDYLKLDILAFAAHPDDAELSCSGTLVSHIRKGYKVGIVDLTRGELGTRGTAFIREQESAKATEIMGVHARENLGFRDGFFTNDEAHQLVVIKAIRKYKPEIILCNALSDRHPDHGKGSDLLRDASFLSGLRMIKTELDGQNQAPWRPKVVYHYIQNNYIEPDIIVDISDTWDIKLQAIKAFKTQFFDPESNEPSTFISSPQFLEFLEARAKEFGHRIGVKYGEGFTCERKPGTDNLFKLL